MMRRELTRQQSMKCSANEKARTKGVMRTLHENSIFNYKENYIMTLYELSSEYMELLAMMEDPDADLEVISDTLEAIGGELEVKADGYARVMRQMDADAKAIKAEEERLYTRRKSLENRSEWLKKRLQEVMEVTGKTKFKTELFSFGIQRNPAAVVIDEQYIENIPEEYLIQQDPKIDRQKIKDDLKAGKDLNGIAHLEQSESLRIR